MLGMENRNTELPAEFVERIYQLYGDEAEIILSQFQKSRPSTFRANTLKISHAEALAELQKAGFELEEVPWLPAFILRNRGLRDLEEHPLYQNGSIYVQGLSSMIPPVVLAPEAGNAVLDIAAAPGSKTTQMAAMMQNEGMIFANDTSTIRLYKLAANLERQGVTNVKTRHGLGEQIWRDFSAVFDKALVDVPCSMEGRFNLQKPKTLDNWSVKKIKELSERQKHLLRSAISSVKPGGEIVYSTCTLSPEENEGVIDWILKKEKGNIVVEDIEIPDGLASKPIAEWNNKTFNDEVQKTKRILPSELYEGFFIAKLRKLI